MIPIMHRKFDNHSHNIKESLEDINTFILAENHDLDIIKALNSIARVVSEMTRMVFTNIDIQKAIAKQNESKGKQS